MSKKTEKTKQPILPLIVILLIFLALWSITPASCLSFREMAADKTASATLTYVHKAQTAYNTPARMTFTKSMVELQAVEINLLPPAAHDSVDWGVTNATATTYKATASHPLGSGVTYTIQEDGVVRPSRD